MNVNWYRENNVDIARSVGIDEVGRGPLAGPVVAAAVWIDHTAIEMLENSKLVVRDSKKMTEHAREAVVNFLQNAPQEHVKISIAEASVEEIDSLNILHATMLAMKRAFLGLQMKNVEILIDGDRKPNIESPMRTIVGGDDKVLGISLASIVAKQYRDHFMQKLAEQFPGYDWEKNVGYGTKKHLQAIHDLGITKWHRESFKPMSEMR